MANKSTPARISNRFFRFYVILIWIMIPALFAGWLYLYGYLDKYEKSQPSFRAGEIARGIDGGDCSSLGLSENDLVALTYFLREYPAPSPCEAVPISSVGGEYIYRLMAGGTPLFSFTLTDGSGSWNVSACEVSEIVTGEYSNALADEQARFVLDFIAANDYSLLYPLMQPAGFREDTPDAFTAYMALSVPERASLTAVRSDTAGYDILADGLLFGHIDMAQTDDGMMKVTSFSLNDARRRAYIAYLADRNAEELLSWFTSGRYQELYALCTTYGYPDGASTRFAAFAANTVDTKTLTCSLYEGSGDETRFYLISDGDHRTVAEFTLTRTQGESGSVWAVTDFSMPVWVPYEGTVTSPACAAVTVDGKLLEKSDILSRTVPKNTDAYLTQVAPDMVTLVTYRVYSAFEPEKIECTDKNGMPLVMTSGGRDTVFALNTCDDAMGRELERFLKDFCTEWGYFSIHDSSISEITKYVERNSTAYIYIYNGDYMWIKDHYRDETTFDDFDFGNFILYNDDTLTCEISYSMTVHYVRNQAVETYTPHYRLFLRKTDGDWKVYSFTNIIE